LYGNTTTAMATAVMNSNLPAALSRWGKWPHDLDIAGGAGVIEGEQPEEERSMIRLAFEVPRCWSASK
jgi:hypothetical protein